MPCGCGETRHPFAFIRHSAIRYRYHHVVGRGEAVPTAQAPHREVLRLFRRAWGTEQTRICVESDTFDDLVARLQSMDLPDGKDVLELLTTRYQHASGLAVLLGRKTAAQETCRLLFQRLRAEVCYAATVRLSIGERRGRYWAIGTRHAHVQGLRGLNGAVGRDLFGTLAAGAALYNLHALHTTGSAPLPVTALALALGGAALFWSTGREIWDPPAVRGNHLRYWWRSLRGQRDQFWMVLGPDPHTATLLFSLFAHLAAHAQLHHSREGGVVEEETYLDLPALLAADAPQPEHALTYRIRFGEDAAAHRRARLLCAPASPYEEPGSLCRRAIARADALWRGRRLGSLFQQQGRVRVRRARGGGPACRMCRAFRRSWAS
ncbi:MAG: hypothetical protein QHJ73_19735, partial [Armatimonadota bacterium]|nr:hypothetical protein [Armatimonadota bacterium]